MKNIEKIADSILKTSAVNRFSFNEVKQAIEQMSRMTEKDLDKILVKSGYSDNKIQTSKFQDFYFGSSNITAYFKTRYIDDMNGDMADGKVYISWDGKNFSGDF